MVTASTFPCPAEVAPQPEVIWGWGCFQREQGPSEREKPDQRGIIILNCAVTAWEERIGQKTQGSSLKDDSASLLASWMWAHVSILSGRSKKQNYSKKAGDRSLAVGMKPPRWDCQSKLCPISLADRTLNTTGRVGFNPQFVQPETWWCTHVLMHLLHLHGHRAGLWGFPACQLHSSTAISQPQALKQRERFHLVLSQFKSAGLVVYSGVPSPIDREK